VRAAAQRLGPQVALSVSDAGAGLAAEQRARLFQPFERPGAEPVADSGLGLALSRQLIAAMGGEVRDDSTPGEGTTFTVVLPGA
jgi:signal transduction histidine kinase